MSDRSARCVLRFADAGELYASWRWIGDRAVYTAALPEAPLRQALAQLHGALPGTADSLESAVTTGAFTEFKSGMALAQQLSAAALPDALKAQVRAYRQAGAQLRIGVQPSPRTARVPWELLPVGTAPLLEFADVSLLAPRSVTQNPARTIRSWAQTSTLPLIVAVDPRVPGHAASSALGSVFGRPDPAGPLAQALHAHQQRGRITTAGEAVALLRRTDADRDWLSRQLRAGASRLLYAGHVTAAPAESGQSENTQLHLACGPQTAGFASLIRGHRPLTAKDLLLGSYTRDAEPRSGAEIWPMPARVALIGCDSGADHRFGEALGLVSAILHNGAELVTASRWTLPTDLAFAQYSGAQGHPLQDSVAAIDAAHESTDPVAAISGWQRRQFADWRKGTAGISPLLWAALATVTG